MINKKFTDFTYLQFSFFSFSASFICETSFYFCFNFIIHCSTSLFFFFFHSISFLGLALVAFVLLLSFHYALCALFFFGFFCSACVLDFFHTFTSVGVYITKKNS